MYIASDDVYFTDATQLVYWPTKTVIKVANS